MKTLPLSKIGGTNQRIGLALAGGGPLGVIYEMGALRALDEALEGVDFNNLYVYVGVSAGALVAATLANQITTAQMCRIFINNVSIEHPFTPEIFLKPAFSAYFKGLASVPTLFVDALWRFILNPRDSGLLESLTSLTRALPAGLFDNETINEFFAEIYSHRQRTNDFRSLKNKLYVVAADLDTGESIRFGAQGYDDIPISKALQASTALPGLFPPVEINGRYFVDGVLQKTLHASIALDKGADLLFCINPIVAFDANAAAQSGSPKHEKLIEGGLPVVLSQMFRAIVHSRMQAGMAKYETQYEDADVLLIEPNCDDAEMFFVNVFSFSNRRRVCEHAYQTTRRELLARRNELEPILARHGVRLRMDVLEDKHRHFCTGFCEDSEIEGQPSHVKEISHQLEDALDELQNWLDSSESTQSIDEPPIRIVSGQSR